MLLIKLRVFTFIPTSLLYLLVFTATYVEGYASWCNINQTLFVPEESTAKIHANFSPSYRRLLTFFKTASDHQIIFRVNFLGNTIHDDDLQWSDLSLENRTLFSGQRNTNLQLDILIEINNISMRDNGTYTLQYYEDFCLILFVMQIRPGQREAVEENKPVYVYAHPHASLITRPLSNATMVWLLDGLSSNQTASFIQQDGLIWIPHVQRGMDGRNVTYRAIQDNGNVNEVNYTLNVKYGPSQSLTLTPRETQYYLVSGDVIPDITCTADCKPPCSISWGIYSSGGTLSLGAVTSDDTGQYTCTATRTGVKSVEQIVNIHVADNTSFTIAVACLAVVQELTTLVLGLSAFLIYRRTKQSPSQTCFDKIARKSPSNPIKDESRLEGAENHGLEQYEDLNTDTRQTNLNLDYVTTTEAGLEAYGNIRLSSSSTQGVQLTPI